MHFEGKLLTIVTTCKIEQIIYVGLHKRSVVRTDIMTKNDNHRVVRSVFQSLSIKKKSLWKLL